jgi:hypothetical protein
MQILAILYAVGDYDGTAGQSRREGARTWQRTGGRRGTARHAQQRCSLTWLLEYCAAQVAPMEILTPEALERWAERLLTSLQIKHYLTRAGGVPATNG